MVSRTKKHSNWRLKGGKKGGGGFLSKAGNIFNKKKSKNQEKKSKNQKFEDNVVKLAQNIYKETNHRYVIYNTINDTEYEVARVDMFGLVKKSKYHIVIRKTQRKDQYCNKMNPGDYATVDLVKSAEEDSEQDGKVVNSFRVDVNNVCKNTNLSKSDPLLHTTENVIDGIRKALKEMEIEKENNIDKAVSELIQNFPEYTINNYIPNRDKPNVSNADALGRYVIDIRNSNGSGKYTCSNKTVPEYITVEILHKPSDIAPASRRERYITAFRLDINNRCKGESILDTNEIIPLYNITELIKQIKQMKFQYITILYDKLVEAFPNYYVADKIQDKSTEITRVANKMPFTQYDYKIVIRNPTDTSRDNIVNTYCEDIIAGEYASVDLFKINNENPEGIASFHVDINDKCLKSNKTHNIAQLIARITKLTTEKNPESRTGGSRKTKKHRKKSKSKKQSNKKNKSH